MDSIVISCFDLTGNMVMPWAEAGYPCYCVDVRHPQGETRQGNIIRVGADMRDWLPPFRPITFAAFFPPCTDVAVSGARWFRDKGLLALCRALGLFYASIRLAEWTQAPYLIENPVSTISTYWRKPDFTFDPCDYAGYPGGENDVLQHISFRANPGETIALVGATGSAKSSLVQLIPRLYDATSGEIRIDGIPVKNYNLDELHARIGMVLQKNELFTGTIIDNLRWGKPDASMEEIEEAARAAEAHDFICSFTEGYNTLLGRGGINVSGGQKQRICIARALLRKPKILILDDSTSAVDTETELKIRNNLNAMLHDTTVFIITQRINTMQSADRVIVLEDGEINAIGTPDELIKRSTVYQEIYHSQQVLF